MKNILLILTFMAMAALTLNACTREEEAEKPSESADTLEDSATGRHMEMDDKDHDHDKMEKDIPVQEKEDGMSPSNPDLSIEEEASFAAADQG